jgi:glycosyltransferase involved in cell wall biosynthesis
MSTLNYVLGRIILVVREESTGENTVVFGPEIWAAQTNGGISRYFVELANNMSSLVSKSLVLIPQHSNTEVEKIENRFELGDLRNDLSMISGSCVNKKIIYHATYYDYKNLRIAKSLGFKTVVTVHDMISEIYPERQPRFRFSLDHKKKAVSLADGIICVSESTKKDLMSIYGVSEEKIQVVHLASSFQLQSHDELGSPRQNFILYVGKRAGYKNFLLLLEAFAGSPYLRDRFKLVAFGGRDFNLNEENAISELLIQERVVHASGDDSVLRDLYLNSRILVYPSLYEGFGLPLVEAMSLGCPVITANVSSMPEVAAGAALYFDPMDMQALKELLEQTLSSEEVLERTAELGLVRSKEFSWQHTAALTSSFYDNL